jgi:glucan phosphorylase
MHEKPLSVLEIAMEMAFPPMFLEEIAKKAGAESARHAAMSTSVGGIGPLLKDRVIVQAEEGTPVTAVSLLYDKVWIQAWHEWGQLNLQKRDIAHTIKKFLTPTDLGFELTMLDDQKVLVEVWKLAYGGADSYFLSCAPITDVVYPGPKDAPRTSPNPSQWSHEFRLKQSWLLGRGALTLAKKLNLKPDVVVLSETPTLFGHHKLVKDELNSDPYFADFRYVFNDHTPLEYAHPIWDQHTLEMAKMNAELYLNSPAWNPTRRTLDVTSLLVGLCDGVYGVAKKTRRRHARDAVT